MVTRELLKGDADGADIAARDAHSRERGVNGVPTFVIAGQHVVSGAQPAELWCQVIDDVQAQLAARRGGARPLLPAPVVSDALAGPWRQGIDDMRARRAAQGARARGRRPPDPTARPAPAPLAIPGPGRHGSRRCPRACPILAPGPGSRSPQNRIRRWSPAACPCPNSSR